MKPIDILFCGGHFSPAIAVIEELRRRRYYQIHYIGGKFPLEGDRAVSLEYLKLTSLKIPFYSINAGRLQRGFTVHTVPSLAKFPLGVWQSLKILSKIKPTLVVSFGGYIALSVSLAASILKIPIITHEQTHALGLANKLIARLSKVLCLTWKDTKGVPRRVKTHISGNPIRSSIDKYNNQIGNFGNKKYPILYVTGGSLGAKGINSALYSILPKLLVKFRIIHQCGEADNNADYKEFNLLKDKLHSDLANNYHIKSHIDPDDIGEILSCSILVISRAGANTVSELAYKGVPAILIPLPWAADNEQMKNAILLSDLGLAKIIEQKNLIPNLLYDTVIKMTSMITLYKKKANLAKKVLNPNAQKEIADLVETYSSNKSHL